MREALWGRGQIGARRLLSLTRGLPPGSALHRSVDPEGWNWGNKEELLAGILERLDWSNILYLSAHGVRDLPKLTKVPRPWRVEEKAPPRRQSSSAELVAAFGGAVKVEKKDKGDEVSD